MEVLGTVRFHDLEINVIMGDEGYIALMACSGGERLVELPKRPWYLFSYFLSIFSTLNIFSFLTL